MDVLNAGVVHATAAARLRIQRTLKYGTEDCRRDFAPVKVKACIVQQNLAQFISKLWYFYLFLEKAAVRIWECFQVIH